MERNARGSTFMLSFFVILALAWLYYIVYTKPYGEKA